MIDRRAFLSSLALGTLAVPHAAPAQLAHKVYRIGILALPETSDMVGPQPRSPVHNALLRGLRELGYVYGEHFVTEPRGAGGKPERFPGLAAELVRLQVDVIVAAGRRQGHSKNGVRLMKAPLSALLSEAVDDGLIPVNPALQLGRRLGGRADKLTQSERVQHHPRDQSPCLTNGRREPPVGRPQNSWRTREVGHRPG